MSLYELIYHRVAYFLLSMNIVFSFMHCSNYTKASKTASVNSEAPEEVPKIIQKWQANGGLTLAIISMTPTDLAIDNSIRTLCAEKKRREFLLEMAQGLQHVADEIIGMFKDRHFLRALKKYYRENGGAGFQSGGAVDAETGNG